MKDDRVVLITGVSSGIGRACAEHLAEGGGYWVFGTSRHSDYELRQQKVKSFDIEWLNKVEIIEMNVNRNESVKKGIVFVMQKAGRIDILINSAGFSLAGGIENTSMMEAKSQLETNFFGVHRVCRQVLPIMRRQESGYIINISSLAGLVGIPFQSFYSASKFALEGYTEGLRMEVKPFGIKVVLVEPGDFNTPFTLHRQITRNLTVYGKSFDNALRAAEESERKGDSPEKIARLVERIINTVSPRLRYKIGPSSRLVSLKSFIPPRLVEWLVRKTFKLT